MPYYINGKDITLLSEIVSSNDPRTSSGFSTSNYFYNGRSYTGTTSKKFALNRDGYIYSGDSGVGSRFMQNGLSSFSVSKKGCRPMLTKRWETSTPGIYYVNKFEDGEVWVSSNYQSRTGTRIATADQAFNYIFTMLISPGGGGGGSSGSVSGGGGGGGSFLFLCQRLVPNCIYRIYIGSGGVGGAGKTNGGIGGQCQSALFSSSNWGTSGITGINIGDAGFGKSGGNGGGGGSGGTIFSGTTNNSYIHRIDERNGTSGGNKGVSGGSTADSKTNTYTPEGNQLSFGQGSGGAGNHGGGGGGGWYYGHNGGKGGAGYENGGSGGIGAGGGGGAYVIFSSRTGGSGGNGYAAVFY